MFSCCELDNPGDLAVHGCGWSRFAVLNRTVRMVPAIHPFAYVSVQDED